MGISRLSIANEWIKKMEYYSVTNKILSLAAKWTQLVDTQLNDGK